VPDHSDLDLSTQAVAEPTTPAADLAAIAHAHPSLRAQVAAHPNTYPDLLDWLASYGGDEAAQAVAARRARGTVWHPSPAAPGALGEEVQVLAATGASSPARLSRVRILVAVVVVAAIVAGCIVVPRMLHKGAHSAKSVVSETGFAISLDDVAVTGAAGVAPQGTEVRLSRVSGNDAKIVDGIDRVEAGSYLYDIEFEGGVQPLKDVTVTWQLEGDIQDLSSVAFVTKRSDTGAWEGLPVTVADGVASVSLTHFSWFEFIRADKVRDWLFNQFEQLVNIGYDPPKCAGKPAVHAGRTWSVITDKNGVYACVENVRGSLGITIYSANGIPWRFRPTPGEAVGRHASAPLKIAPMVTLAIYDTFAGQNFTKETLLVPGGSASVIVNDGVTETVAEAKLDAFYWLVSTLISVLDVYLDIKLGAAMEAKSVAECVVGLLGAAGGNPGENLGEVASVTLGCMGDLLTAPGKIVVAVVTSLGATLWSGLQGGLMTLFDYDHVKLTATSNAAAASPSTTSGDCSEASLRAARDDTIGNGGKPLTDTAQYDVFTLHGCSSDWALVESSRSSGSFFSFWLMRHDSGGWHIIAQAATRNDTPMTDGLFSAAVLSRYGYSKAEIVDAIGSTTRDGRPIFF